LAPAERGKEKEAFYLLPETLDAIEEIRRVLRHTHGISRRGASKSSIVDAAIAFAGRHPDLLAEWIRSKK